MLQGWPLALLGHGRIARRGNDGRLSIDYSLISFSYLYLVDLMADHHSLNDVANQVSGPSESRTILSTGYFFFKTGADLVSKCPSTNHWDPTLPLP